MTLQELLSEAKKLSPQEQLQLATRLLQWAELQFRQVTPKPTKKLRTPGLNPGSCVFGDDFDDPLPDSFWLGEG